MARPVNRLTPVMPVQAYKTYQLSAPISTHHRRASCAEVECERWRNGWVTALDERTEDGARRAGYIRTRAGRAFRERPDPSGLTVFTFSPGQRCFKPHFTPLERDPLCVVRGGDWRGLIGQRRVHQRPEHWVEDFALHQDSLATRFQRG
jgi:hypothetical protein